MSKPRQMTRRFGAYARSGQLDLTLSPWDPCEARAEAQGARATTAAPRRPRFFFTLDLKRSLDREAGGLTRPDAVPSAEAGTSGSGAGRWRR